MNQIEHILPNLSRLKHLQIQVEAPCDLDDGNRWQILTYSLITFNFKFRINYGYHSTLDSFRTSFWLEEKHWFVAYNDEYLFSIPYFCPTEVTASYRPPLMSTVPDETIFSKSITKLTLSTELTYGNYRLNNIQILKINCFLLISNLINIVDLSQVKYLILSSLNSVSVFVHILPFMSRLVKLTIAGHLVPKLMEEIQGKSLEQIRSLELSFCYQENAKISEKLCQLFPLVDHLNVSLINSTDDIIRFFRNFQYLSNAVFGINSLYKSNKERDCQKLKLAGNDKFACQIMYPSNRTLLSYIYIWNAE
jgi:hypothetical protein